MCFRLITILSLPCLLLFLNSVEASTEMHLMNDGKPIQVHVIDQSRDLNHEKPQADRHQLTSGLKDTGKNKTQAGVTGFVVPLRRGLSNNEPEIHTIAAFVDHNDVKPDSLLDWNCGERSYDAETFNHNGTDYNSSQFFWLTMANDGVVVIAAQDGEIIDIHDGEFDKHCAFDPNAESNLVVLKHSDDIITIYAHMKTGSVTPRKVGDMVEQGDYLGVMGSSGLSTGPHLHLGVQDFFNNLFDPYAGECNALNNESFWADQESYYEKSILSVATHSAAPEYPPCPQEEVPHFNDVFGLNDDIFVAVTVRDFEGTDEIYLEIRDPSNQVITSTTFADDSIGFAQAFSIVFGGTLINNPEVGKYILSATYGGQTREHSFYIGTGPDPIPEAKASNNAFTGLWYDPALDGEGFNIVTTPGGTIVYFYGSDNRGNRVWLISDPIPGEIKTGTAITVLMFESTGGVFPTPVQSSRGLATWGTLALLFTDCMNGRSELNGMDGFKESRITKLAGVGGASCVDGDTPADSGWAGLWYDPSKDGEGYNLIVSPIGRILYFYGFKASGLRLWLISELITQTLEVGKTVEVKVFEADQGTFSDPVPSSEALLEWGTAKITVVDCNTVTIVITGIDGSKTSNTIRLAGIIGLSCPG